MDQSAVLAVLFVIVCLFGALLRNDQKRRAKEAQEFNPQPSFQSARWADENDLKRAGVFKKGGIYIGLSPGGRPMYQNKPGHALIVVGSRMGKLYTLIVSLISRLGRRHSLIMLDPKLEMTPIVARIRAAVGKLYVWNPYNVWPDHLKHFRPASFNPVLDIKLGRECYSECRRLLETFWDSVSKALDPHWLTGGLEVAATALYTLRNYGKEHEMNLPTLFRVLAGANAPFVEFAQYACSLGDPVINQGLAEFAREGANKDKELRSILKAAKTQFAWLDPMLSASLKRADFSLMDLKRVPGMTVCCGLPLHQQSDGKAVALLTGWSLYCCLKKGSEGHKTPVVALIDEMASLGSGPTKQWLDAFANGAGAGGISIVGVYQNIGQLAEQVGDHAVGTVLNNCETVLYWGVSATDTATQKKVSESAGIREFIAPTKNVNWQDPTNPNVGYGKSVKTSPLIQPHEVSQLAPGRMIAFVRGLPPVLGRRKPYPQMENGYGQNPFYKGGMFGRFFGGK